MISAPSATSCKTPIQRRFDFPDLPTGRAFLSINAVMGILDKSEDDILNLIELGRLEYAFDIRSAGAAKREPRILALSVSAYCRGAASCGKSLDQVLADLWPHRKPSLRISEIYRCWNCSSQHVLTLWREGHFGPTPPVSAQVLQRISPSVPRIAVLNFLKQRRLP